jgi:hypothetical protein
MATSSLLNFTVPLSDIGVSASGQGLIMPKLKYRFRILFIGFGVSTDTTELTKQVVDFKRPSVKFDEQVIDVYNSKVHYAGKPAWDATTVTLRDDVESQIQTLVGQQVQRQFDFLNQASAASASDYKFEMLCQMLDGGNGISEPTITETWDLTGCYISNADYDSLDYKTSDPVVVKLGIVFDNAIQTAYGVGSPVPRLAGVLAI